jgi:hypothetical protein
MSEEETRFARVEVAVTRHDGQVLAWSADWPRKAGVTMETGLQPAIRDGAPWPSVIGPPRSAKLLVEVEADGERPPVAEVIAAARWDERAVITAQDRELLAPVLGDERMVALMGRDREAWMLAGALVTRAFAAGKRAATP